MTELPFKMTFDLDFSKKPPQKKLLERLFELFLNINPKPCVNVYFGQINQALFDFIFNTLKHLNLNIYALNPVLDDLLLDLAKNQIVNIKITNENYDLSKLKGTIYNLILPISKNIYAYVKKIDNPDINKITIYHNKDNASYFDIKKQIKLINEDSSINQKCYLLPYLQDYEQEAYYSSKEKIRPFLTCSALWLNPVITSEGKVSLPCCYFENSILHEDFFELWNRADINALRDKLIDTKQFSNCKHCEKFYQNNFFIVEDNVLQYKNKKYVFDNVLNPVKSAPIIAVVSDDNVCIPVSIYSDEQIQKIYDDKMVLLIK